MSSWKEFHNSVADSGIKMIAIKHPFGFFWKEKWTATQIFCPDVSGQYLLCTDSFKSSFYSADSLLFLCFWHQQSKLHLKL